MIKDFKPRLYQETVFATTAEKNCLVVLPTGMGKTQIALMLAAHRLKQYPKSKILIVVLYLYAKRHFVSLGATK